MVNNLTTKEAVEILVKSFELDPAYKTLWQLNLALCFYNAYTEDENVPKMESWELVRISDKAAENFLKQLSEK